MKVLVIGQGGREHALAKALKDSPEVSEVHALPGNDGMAVDVVCHSVKTSDHEAILGVIKRVRIDLVVIGPEVELDQGLSDVLRASSKLLPIANALSTRPPLVIH